MWSYAGIIKIVLLALVAFETHGQESSTIAYISEVQVENIGGVVELQCTVANANDHNTVWSKDNDSLIISIGPSLVIRDSRYEIHYNHQTSTYTLKINNIRESDAGFYRCSILISVDNRISQDVELIVRTPPAISDNSTSSLIAREGEHVQLECYATGVPNPRISWKRQLNRALPTGGSIYYGNVLLLKNITKEQRGTYYCIADNAVGKADKRSVQVTVQFPPAISVSQLRVGQALQREVKLECRVESNPPPTVVWIKDNEVLRNSELLSIEHFETIEDITNTNVAIYSVKQNQYGRYICKATNALGMDMAQIELYETDDAVLTGETKPLGHVNQTEETNNQTTTEETISEIHTLSPN